MKETVYRYSLYDEYGVWLGEVILTNIKEFFALTDYGNFNTQFSTRIDIHDFMLGINEDYLAKKMFQSMYNQRPTQQLRNYCACFAAHILPALKKAINERLKQREEVSQ